MFLLSFNPPPCIMFEENNINWLFLGSGLTNLIFGFVLTITGTENLMPLNRVFNFVLKTFDSFIR